MKKYIFTLYIFSLGTGLNGMNKQESIEEQLVFAIRARNTELVRKLLTENKVNLSYRFHKSRKSLLMEANGCEQEDIVKLLLQKGSPLDEEFLYQAYNELENSINSSPKKLKLIVTYSPSSTTSDLLTNAIRHLNPTALKIFLKASVVPTDEWEVSKKLYYDNQKPETLQEYYSLLRRVNPESYTIPEEATWEEARRYIQRDEKTFKLIGRILRDHLGLYTERSGISKHGIVGAYGLPLEIAKHIATFLHEID